jgi:hypothetical protein
MPRPRCAGTVAVATTDTTHQLNQEKPMISDGRVNGFGWYLGAFVLGAAVGGTIALLAAPRTGRETRERLKKRAIDLQKTVEQVPGTMQRAAARAVKAGQVAFESGRDELR